MKCTTLTPTLADYAAGRTIAPLWVSPSGRAFYPIAGGSQDPDPAPDPTPDPQPDPTPDPAPDPKPDKGFPENTPVAEMTVEQRAAYWEHQSKKHEGRNRDLLKITGGKYGDELREQFDELGRLRTEHMSDGEKAVEQAKAEGRREASLALAPQMFDVALSHVDEDRRKVLIDSIDLSKVLNTDGTIDTDKVTTLASTIAPADKGQGSQRDPDYGGGKRRESGSTGVKSGVALYESRRKKSTTES